MYTYAIMQNEKEDSWTYNAYVIVTKTALPSETVETLKTAFHKWLNALPDDTRLDYDENLLDDEKFITELYGPGIWRPGFVCRGDIYYCTLKRDVIDQVLKDIGIEYEFINSTCIGEFFSE